MGKVKPGQSDHPTITTTTALCNRQCTWSVTWLDNVKLPMCASLFCLLSSDGGGGGGGLLN